MTPATGVPRLTLQPTAEVLAAAAAVAAPPGGPGSGENVWRKERQRVLRERCAGFDRDLIPYFCLISSRRMPVPGL